MSGPVGRRLCYHGALLFLLGLINGVFVSSLANPRMGLSAHLAGVQGGMVLMIFGALWAHVVLSERWKRVAELSGVVSQYLLWAALLLAAGFGTGRATPIAGAGHEGAAWQEFVVTLLLYLGSALILLAALLVTAGFRGGARKDGVATVR